MMYITTASLIFVVFLASVRADTCSVDVVCLLGKIDELEKAVKGNGTDGGTITGTGTGRTREPNTVSDAKKMIYGDGLFGPRYIAIANDGTAYVSLSSGNVIVYDSKGNKQRDITTSSTEQQGISVDGNQLLIADYHGNKIEEYTIGGQHVGTKYYIPITAPSSAPIGVAKDSAGNIYVTQAKTGIAQIYNKNGVAKNIKIGEPSNVLHNVRLDDKGNMYTAVYSGSTSSSSIKVYSNSGNLIKSIPSPSKGIDGCFIDSKGTIFAAMAAEKKVSILDSSGTLIKDIHNSRFKEPTDVAIAPDGTLWVVDYQYNMIFLY